MDLFLDEANDIDDQENEDENQHEAETIDEETTSKITQNEMNSINAPNNKNSAIRQSFNAQKTQELDLQITGVPVSQRN